jgi:plastocyanin
MRRSIWALGVLALLGGMIVAPGAGASGGGACYSPLTGRATTEARIKNFCFGPTAIHIRPGATVTWTNRDEVAHTVTGANRVWGGYKKLWKNDTVSWQFKRPGVYPYYCVLHWGMMGAVVVEDDTAGLSTGKIGPSDARKVKALVPSAAELPPASPVPAATEPDAGTLFLTGAAGILLVLGSWRIRRAFLRRHTN